MNMRPLSNRRLLTWLCVFPFDKSASLTAKLSYMLVGSVTVAAIFSIIIASATVIPNVKSDLEVTLYILTQLTGYIGGESIIITAFFMRHKIKRMFDDLANIYDSCERKQYIQYSVFTSVINGFIFRQKDAFVLTSYRDQYKVRTVVDTFL